MKIINYLVIPTLISSLIIITAIAANNTISILKSVLIVFSFIIVLFKLKIIVHRINCVSITFYLLVIVANGINAMWRERFIAIANSLW